MKALGALYILHFLNYISKIISWQNKTVIYNLKIHRIKLISPYPHNIFGPKTLINKMEFINFLEERWQWLNADDKIWSKTSIYWPYFFISLGDSVYNGIIDSLFNLKTYIILNSKIITWSLSNKNWISVLTIKKISPSLYSIVFLKRSN